MIKNLNALHTKKERFERKKKHDGITKAICNVGFRG
jgi:hypothetical protein